MISPEYVDHLATLLVTKVGESGFRTLCKEMGSNYDEIRGDDLPSKAHTWIRDVDAHGAIPELVRCGMREYPDLVWRQRDPNVAPRKYFLASKLPPMERSEYLIADPYFEQTFDPLEADLLVFDLDHPPADWINYVGCQETVFHEPPYYETTVFVGDCAPGHPASTVQWTGATILETLNPHRTRMHLVTSPSEMKRKIMSVADHLKWASKTATRQALASTRAPSDGRRP